MEGNVVWAAPELQTDGAAREMDALSISLDSESRGKERSRVEGVKREPELAEARLWSSNLLFGKGTLLWELLRASEGL